MRNSWQTKLPGAGYQIYIYTSITNTAVKIYLSDTSTTPIGTVPQIITDDTGLVKFWVDSNDYDLDQRFNIDIYDPTGKFWISQKFINIFSLKDYLLEGIGTNVDKVDGHDASPTPQPNEIPVVDEDGNLYLPNIPIKTNFDTDVITLDKVFAYIASKTGTGSAVVSALNALVGIKPVVQYSGTTGNVEIAFKESGGSFTDITSALSEDTDNVTLFDNNGDYLYIGNSNVCGLLLVELATYASSPGIKPTFEYSIGNGNWSSFTPADTTSGFRSSGSILWDVSDLTGWATDTVNGVTKYWIRIGRTANNLNTLPVENHIKTCDTITYSWDENGNVTVKSVTAEQLISTVSTGTQPFKVSSTTKVDNLNADLLDGYQAKTINSISFFLGG